MARRPPTIYMYYVLALAGVYNLHLGLNVANNELQIGAERHHSELSLSFLRASLDALGRNYNANVNVSSSELKLPEEIATENTKKEQAFQNHRKERIRLARDRAEKPPKQYSYADDSTSNSSIVEAFKVDGAELLDIDTMKHTYKPKDEWRNININNNQNNVTIHTTGVAYPNIEIVGLPKSGTSQLYSILTNRPDTIKFHPTNKEYCSSIYSKNKSMEEVQQGYYDWHEDIYTRNQKRFSIEGQKNNATPPFQSVNGCIWVQDAILRHTYLKSKGTASTRKQQQHQQKYIVLLRDPADWMWVRSFYMFSVC